MTTDLRDREGRNARWDRLIREDKAAREQERKDAEEAARARGEIVRIPTTRPINEVGDPA